jgi:hypothetical protein
VKHPVDKEKIAVMPEFDEIKLSEQTAELQKFCNAMKGMDERNQQLMKNLVIIRLISTVEYHLKGVIAYLIDELEIKAQRILVDDWFIPIRPDVLDNIHAEQFSKGNILTVFLDRVNPSRIRDTMSNVNSVDFFPWYAEIKSIFKKDSKHEKIWNHFNEIYQLRNDIIHNLHEPEITIGQLQKEIKAFGNFPIECYFYTLLNLGIFEDKLESQEIKDLIKGNNIQHPGNFRKQFEEITKKYRNEYNPGKKTKKRK